MILTAAVMAHAGGHGAASLRKWTNASTGVTVSGSYLLERQDSIYLEDETGKTIIWPLRELSRDDQQYVTTQQTRVRALNQPRITHTNTTPAAKPTFSLPALAIAVLLIGVVLWCRRSGVQFVRVAIAFLLLCVVLATYAWRQQAQTNRPAIAASFDAYSPKVRTRWDAKYLYVESDGIPDHPMMKGIKTWQQQVPIPQPYISENAWSIPLNPVIAAQPISAKTALFTGAIALAVNGIPIFNALNNRGVDSFSIGELDDWGGHCGRADDYHYHAAPLHLQQKVGTVQPIGYALDGFPLYGLNEPDGAVVTGLDEFNGHFDANNKYHYHSTKTYPYINGGLRGEVTVSNDQIVPQPRANSPRPSTSPLTGAAITNWQSTGTNAWSLEYTINNQIYKVNYSYDYAGNFVYEFVDPSGNKRTENYARKGVATTVSAASYKGVTIAPESIASVFGTGLATAARSAPSLPLPTDLNGTKVRVIDSQGIERLAPLFYVSPTQINYQIPAGTSAGLATISVGTNNNLVGAGVINVAATLPGVFAAAANGTGYAAANIQRVRNGSSTFEDVVRFDSAQNKYVPIPIDFGAGNDELYLVLYGTGIRGHGGLNNVRATVGGVESEVVYASGHCCYVGVDQVNIRLPNSLAGRGDVDVVLTVDGVAANAVKLNFKGASLISWSMLKLPDTGVTTHYASILGDDADYTRNAPAFANNGDGTVNDLITGLQWQQSDGGEMARDAAPGYCTSLTVGGHNDWRLPSVKELFSIQAHNALNPAINTTYFTKTAAEYWWASDLRSDDATRSWATNAGGGAGAHPKTETVSAGGTKKFHVRCVRTPGNGLSLTEIFKDNGNGTITDNRTGLTWQQADAATVMSWEEAIAYAESLSLGGFDDWRLPNIKELVSLNDEGRVRPSLNTSYFAAPSSALFWSSTTQFNQTPNAWTVDFTFGISSYNPKTDKLRVRCVRGGN